MRNNSELPHDLKDALASYYDFWFKLNALYEKWGKQRNLTFNALFVLYVLGKAPNPCTQRMVCEQLQLPKQTVNAILETFEKKGYITRETMATDRRAKCLLFTETGKSYADQILTELYHFEIGALQSMSPEQRRHLLQSSHTFLTNLTQIFTQEKMTK